MTSLTIIQVSETSRSLMASIHPWEVQSTHKAKVIPVVFKGMLWITRYSLHLTQQQINRYPSVCLGHRAQLCFSNLHTVNHQVAIQEGL